MESSGTASVQSMLAVVQNKYFFNSIINFSSLKVEAQHNKMYNTLWAVHDNLGYKWRHANVQVQSQANTAPKVADFFNTISILQTFRGFIPSIHSFYLKFLIYLLSSIILSFTFFYNFFL